LNSDLCHPANRQLLYRLSYRGSFSRTRRLCGCGWLRTITTDTLSQAEQTFHPKLWIKSINMCSSWHLRINCSIQSTVDLWGIARNSPSSQHAVPTCGVAKSAEVAFNNPSVSANEDFRFQAHTWTLVKQSVVGSIHIPSHWKYLVLCSSHWLAVACNTRGSENLLSQCFLNLPSKRPKFHFSSVMLIPWLLNHDTAQWHFAPCQHALVTLSLLL
jgi:hypothetical protein